jgi:hypothetical protein
MRTSPSSSVYLAIVLWTTALSLSMPHLNISPAVTQGSLFTLSGIQIMSRSRSLQISLKMITKRGAIVKVVKFCLHLSIILVIKQLDFGKNSFSSKQIIVSELIFNRVLITPFMLKNHIDNDNTNLFPSPMHRK